MSQILPPGAATYSGGLPSLLPTESASLPTDQTVPLLFNVVQSGSGISQLVSRVLIGRGMVNHALQPLGYISCTFHGSNDVA